MLFHSVESLIRKTKTLIVICTEAENAKTFVLLKKVDFIGTKKKCIVKILCNSYFESFIKEKTLS